MINIRKINCNQCGAPADLHGGHKVQSLTCAYCGSVMDAQDNYKLIVRFKKKQANRPNSVLKIGMQCNIKDVNFTIIGMIRYTSENIYNWLDFQLYSPTHGYAWITIENGHYTFSRRTREVPIPASPHKLKTHKKVNACGHELEVYEKYKANITYVEGELTWIAKMGDKISVTDAIDPPYAFSYEKTGNNELEYTCIEYLETTQIQAMFKLEQVLKKPTGVYSSQPYNQSNFSKGLVKAGKFYAILAMIIIFMIVVTNPSNNQPLLSENIPAINHGNKHISKQFTVKSNKVIELRINLQPNKNTTAYEIEIVDSSNISKQIFSITKIIKQANKNLLFSKAKEIRIAFNSGSTGLNYKDILKAGNYKLKINPISNLGKTTPKMAVNIYHPPKQKTTFIFVVFMIFSIIVFWIAGAAKKSFEVKRWANVD
jgi:methionine-rich copper-binding protein CopC